MHLCKDLKNLHPFAPRKFSFRSMDRRKKFSIEDFVQTLELSKT